MARQFDAETYAFCSEVASSRTGEHVWPVWFLKLSPVDEGPYTWLIDGEPVRKRDGLPRRHSSIGAVKLPACRNCNEVLKRRFEDPAKHLVRSLMRTDGNIVIGPSETTNLGLWFVKTWLLLAHPAARYSEPGINPSRWHPENEDLYSWMVADRDPPEGLSLWIFKQRSDRSGALPVRHIPLPTVVTDGRVIEFRSMRVGIRSFDVSLVYHPGWEIEHPLEIEGRALRLWPRRSDAAADFAILPHVDPTQTRWLKGPRVSFFPGAFESGRILPLSPASNLFDLAPGLVQMVSW